MNATLPFNLAHNAARFVLSAHDMHFVSADLPRDLVLVIQHVVGRSISVKILSERMMGPNAHVRRASIPVLCMFICLYVRDVISK